MTSTDRPPEETPEEPASTGGERAPAHGTPVPVDMSHDHRVRDNWVIFLAGPVTFISHFMAVYLVAEAGCTGGGPGLEVLDPPVPVMFTLVATVVAAAICAAAAAWALRWWRSSAQVLDGPSDEDSEELPRELDDDRRRGTLAFSGFLLSGLSLVAVLFVGAPALVLGPC